VSLVIEIADQTADFERLEQPWRQLSVRVSYSRFTQGYDWCYAGWQNRSTLEKAVLKLLAVWQGNQLVAVWPLMQVLCAGTRQLQVIGAGLGEEYADPLIDPAVNSHDTCALMLRALQGHADTLNFHFLTQNSIMADALRHQGRFIDQIECSAFLIDATDTPDLEAHMKRYSSHFRKEVRRKINTLNSLGQLQFELATTEREIDEITSWLMQHKHNWILKRSINRDWFSRASSLDFMHAVSRANAVDGRVGLFGLRLDGKLIAASASIIDRVGVEGMFMTYDMDYAQYSPGLVIVVEQLRWAQQRGMILDMRILEVDFKRRIATASRVHQSFVVATSTKGVLKIAPKLFWDKLRHSAKKLLPVGIYQWLKQKKISIKSTAIPA